VKLKTGAVSSRGCH